MPEGDTVLHAANALHRVLAGKSLTRGDLNWPSAPATGLAGDEVVEVAAYAKHMLIRLGSGRTLHTHLRMDGVWRVVASDSREARRTSPYVRAALGTASHTALGYRLGMLDVCATTKEHSSLAHMGPDILSDFFVPTPFLTKVSNDPTYSLAPRMAGVQLSGFTPAPVPGAVYLELAGHSHDEDVKVGGPANLGTESGRHQISTHKVISDADWRTGIKRFDEQPRHRPIGETLLDQTVVSGIGTIHMAEGLFTRRISPFEPIENVKVPSLLAAIRENMVRASLNYPTGRTIHVHSRNGQPCHRCRGTIIVEEVGPELKRRPAFYCPRCQQLSSNAT